jgi:hypothetical protein
MKNIFEISEKATIENTAALEAAAATIATTEAPAITGKTTILKILLNGSPYYHFSTVEFDNELATRDEFVRVSGKSFYKGLKSSKRHARLKLKSLA